MKKLLMIGFIALVTAALMAPSALAFGNCAGKSHSTKTAGTSSTDKDKS